MRRSQSDLSRRDLFKVASAGLAASMTAAACTRRPPQARDVPLPPVRSAVALLAADTYDSDFADLIWRGCRELGVSLAGKRVLLKPNMVEYENSTVINTHPRVVAGAADACRRLGAREVIVGEGPGHRRDIEHLVRSTGLYEVLRDHRLRFVDLNHDDVKPVPLRTGFTELGEVSLPVELLASDVVVSMPKLKTHHWAGLTCSMKNLFGTVPGAVYGWPKNLLHWRGIHNSILDLAATIRPALAIVDGVVAMEGDGPIMGRPRAAGFLAIGQDPVAVDATCARAIGLDPFRVPYLEQASTFLGNASLWRIEHRGERPARYRFQFEMPPTIQGVLT